MNRLLRKKSTSLFSLMPKLLKEISPYSMFKGMDTVGIEIYLSHNVMILIQDFWTGTHSVPLGSMASPGFMALGVQE